jgi:hypothetical protein
MGRFGGNGQGEMTNDEIRMTNFFAVGGVVLANGGAEGLLAGPGIRRSLHSTQNRDGGFVQVRG